MTADERFARTRAFERDVMRRSSTRVEPFAFGTAYLHDELPRRYSSNLLWVDPAARSPSADALVAEAERILGGAGLEHRKVNVDGEHGRALAPSFLDLGWTAHHLVVMTLERPPDRPAALPVLGVEFETARPVIAEVIARAEYSADDEDVRQLVEHKRVLRDRTGARFFLARVDGRGAGVCEMYASDGVAQIEDVNTLEELRGRGAARAVVLAACDAARAEGAEMVFLVADENDWPKHLYARLGFDAVGSAWEFVRPPAS